MVRMKGSPWVLFMVLECHLNWCVFLICFRISILCSCFFTVQEKKVEGFFFFFSLFSVFLQKFLGLDGSNTTSRSYFNHKAQLKKIIKKIKKINFSL